MNHETLRRQLEAPFPEQQIHWRVGATNKDKTSGIGLAYVDARDVMQRLDDVCGLDWSCEYTLADNGLLVCRIGILVNDRWVYRSNGAGDTNVEQEKGKASDAFKRAAVLFGVARYLYSLPNEWYPLNDRRQLKNRPKLPKWATPEGWYEGAPSPLMAHQSVLRDNLGSVQAIQENIASGQLDTAAEAWYELSDEEKRALWLATSNGGIFTTAERGVMKSPEFTQYRKAE